MEIIYLLIPIALVLVTVVIWIFIWAVRSDQFDDLEGPAHKIIMDNDDVAQKKDGPDQPKQQPRQ